MAESGCALGALIAMILACLGGLFLIPVGVETSPMELAPPMVVTAQFDMAPSIVITGVVVPTEDSWHTKPVEATPTPRP